jgi:hypothetical protein
MERRLIVAFLLTCASLVGAPARAYYVPLFTIEMIGRADAIVLGTIEKVGSEDFELRVEQPLYGSAAGPLRVRSFRDWTCASRWAPYRVGQRLILFLTAGTPADPRWAIVGAGDEGEMLVVGKTVYHQLWPDWERRVRTHHVSGRKFYGATAPLSDVADALAAYRSLYRIVPDEREWFARDVVRISTEEAAREFSRRSDFHRLLAHQSAHFVELSKDRS